jgi:hypothetical protein
LDELLVKLILHCALEIGYVGKPFNYGPYVFKIKLEKKRIVVIADTLV